MSLIEEVYNHIFMIVFIDESGDPGFKLDKGSSRVFVVSMVIFKDSNCAQLAQDKLFELQKTIKAYPEFKFNKLPNAKRDAFFQAVSELEFICRAVVVQKDLIYSPNLRTNKESFYKFFIRMMMEHDAGILENARVIIDGSGDRNFKKQFCAYLKRNIAKEAVTKISLKDSKKDFLVQLADMTAGAIARSYNKDKPNSSIWKDKLLKNKQLQNIWEFK